jgi:hypothetical protein
MKLIDLTQHCANVQLATVARSSLRSTVRRVTAVAFVAVWTLVASNPTWAAVCGDANGDDAITVTDGVQVLRAAADLPSGCLGASVCDVDGSGTLTVSDGVNVLRAAAGLSATLMCGATPTPNATTPSPTPTAAPTPSRSDVSFPVNPCSQTDPKAPGFKVEVHYPLRKGSFVGSGTGAGTGCRTSSGAMFVTVNDQDNGVLFFMLANPTAFSFPIELTCTFDVNAGNTLTANDISVSVETVATFDNNDVPVVGDRGLLCIGVSVAAIPGQ